MTDYFYSPEQEIDELACMAFLSEIKSIKDQINQTNKDLARISHFYINQPRNTKFFLEGKMPLIMIKILNNLGGFMRTLIVLDFPEEPSGWMKENEEWEAVLEEQENICREEYLNYGTLCGDSPYRDPDYNYDYNGPVCYVSGVRYDSYTDWFFNWVYF